MRLYGKNPVLERIKADPGSISKIYISQGHEETDYIRQKAKQHRIPFLIVPYSKIQKIARNLNTQGLLAEISNFSYRPYDDLLAQALSKDRVPVFLDGLNDPQNLGAIVRSLAALGNFSVVLPTHYSVGVTETVLRVACGGESYVPIAQVANLAQAIAAARAAGIWIMGAVVGQGSDLRETVIQFPVGLVVGSEQKGIREVIRQKLDAAVTLPMAHPRLSLNAAQAVTVFCYEIMRRKRARGKS